jgi:folate-dependent phosphoribosylglycinamide formyltransferase PurN
MSVVFICGSHPRHAYIARKLAETGHLSYLIIEQREAHLPSPPSSLNTDMKALFAHHFAERERVETLFFGQIKWPAVPILQVSKETLNSKDVANVISRFGSKLLLSYGCHKLDDSLIKKAGGHAWNCHGGLSPWYKGAITHFWPSYMLEPQMTGMTVHQLTCELDAGGVVHQCVSPLVEGDTLHMLAARAVIQLADELPKLLEIAVEQETVAMKEHTTTGMLWRAEHWQPHHLTLIYRHYEDRIVDLYLAGELNSKEPKLFRQFD